jgi:hypothetical protein
MDHPRTTEYRRGYSAGYAAGRDTAVRHLEDPGGDQPRLGKYGFVTLKVGALKVIEGTTDTVACYHAGRKWAQRHAPSRRFAIHPHPKGLRISRTA